MEQEEGHQWILHPHAEEEEEEEEEMVEDAALIRKKSLSHDKGNLIINEVTSSSSSSSNGSEHSNGVWSVITAPDGSTIQKEEEVAERGDGGEDSNHVNGDKEDYAAVGLAQVAEFAVGETNGEDMSGVAVSQNMSNVYFDKKQDYEVNGVQNGDGLNGVKTGDGLNGVQNGDASGSVHPTNLGESKFDVQADQSVIQNNLCSEITEQSMKTVDNKLLSSPELSHLHNSSDVQVTAVTNSHKETNTNESPNLIEVIDQQLEEFDVEAVLAKQETHDLFCPKCRSCITKRVILRKRKRNSKSLDNGKRDKLEIINNYDNETKLDKLETIGSSEIVDSSAQSEPYQGDQVNVAPDIVGPEPPADDIPPRGAPEVFTCLSCFSLFIPSGKCFDLFRNFGGAKKKENAQNPSSVPANHILNPSNPQGSNANWFMSLIKGKKASDASLQHSGTGSAEQCPSASITLDEPTYPEIGHSKGPLVDTSGIKNVKPTPDINHGNGGMNILISSTDDQSTIESSTNSAGDLMNKVQDFIDFSQEKQFPGRNLMINEAEKKNASDDIIQTVQADNVKVKPSVSITDEKVSKYKSLPSAAATTTQTKFKAEVTANDTVPKPNEGKPEILVSTTVGCLVLEEPPKDVNNKQDIFNGYSSSGQGAQLQIQSSGSEILATDVASTKLNSEIDAIFPPKLDFTHNVQNDICKEINTPTRNENEGGDVIVDVDGGAPESKTSQIPDNFPAEGAIVPGSHSQVGEQPRDELGEPQGWEIVKSIVYGGLVESITSLGLVSSAISSGATPLNIIALGFANIIGGLFILGHNLIDLKNDPSGENQTQMNVQDRYQELLGRRANFLLHAVVAVLSFLIFGSVPLVIYGIVINKNYYNEVKLAAVAACSIVCIILLVIGKVYTSRPPKTYFKTVFYHVTLALSASGVSYLAGNLIKDLLEKFSHSESGFAITMPISDTSMKSAWMSY